MLIYAIDDERAVLNYTIKALIEYYKEDEVLGFSDVDEMLTSFEKKPADIVFLDIEMPGYNGIELAQKLNTLKADLNIIFVTGYDQYAVEAFDVYASDYMKKPCTIEKIEKGTAKFTLENYSSVKVGAKVTFDTAEYETGKKFTDPTLAFDEDKDATTEDDGKITLDTANGNDTYSKTNVPTGEITVTVTPATDDFKTLSATTKATKYGTYTVTIKELR